jgi:hypothetical protein
MATALSEIGRTFWSVWRFRRSFDVEEESWFDTTLLSAQLKVAHANIDVTAVDNRNTSGASILGEVMVIPPVLYRPGAQDALCLK